MGYNSALFINNDEAAALKEKDVGNQIYNALQNNEAGAYLSFGKYMGNTRSSNVVGYLIGGNTFSKIPGVYSLETLNKPVNFLKALVNNLGYRVVKKKEVSK